MIKFNQFVICLLVIVNQFLIINRTHALAYGTHNKHKLTLVADSDSLMPIISIQIDKKDFEQYKKRNTGNEAKLLSLHLIQDNDTSAIAVSSNYHWQRNMLVLQPMVILFPGSSYLIRWKNEKEEYLSMLYKTPNTPSLSPSIVTDIYPQVDTIPENILFFQVRFSQKMSPNVFAWKNVHIREKGGEEIDLAWRQKSYWQDSNRLLLLMIHPGRVKRAIHYKEALLAANKSYELEIDSNIKDIFGNSIASSFKKTFRVKERDSILPKVLRITNHIKANTKESFTISFSETMDYGSIKQGIKVIQSGLDSVEVPVNVSLLNGGKELFITPLQNWVRGNYTLRINAITDLAVNSLKQLFETKTIDDQLENRIPIDYSFQVK